MGFGNLACRLAGCDSGFGMTHYPHINALQRATRVQLPTTPAVIKLIDGNRAKARLQVVSTTGGLLHLTKALSEGDFVEVVFETRSGNVNGMAEMLNPVRSVPGSVFQAFRFVALGDDDHKALHTMIETATDTTFAGIRSSDWSLRNL